MIAIICLGAYLGYILDEKFPNDLSLWTAACSLAGVIISLVYVIRKVLNDK